MFVRVNITPSGVIEERVYRREDAIVSFAVPAQGLLVQVSGVAGGDLGGNYPNPTVDGLQGRAVSSEAPDVDDVLTWNGSAWAPVTSSGGGGTNDHSVLINRGATDAHVQYLLTSSYEVFSTSVDSHISDATIHFTEASIDHTAIQNIGSNTHTQIDTHIADGTIHFTEASIDHTAIQNVGSNTHTQIDSHIADGTIHFVSGDIVHNDLSGLATGDPHTQYALVDGTRAFTGDITAPGVTGSHTEVSSGVPFLLAEGSVTITTGSNGQITISGSGGGGGGTNDHSLLINRGAEDAHVQYLLTSSYEVFSSSVATHIADGTIHFTEASIDHTAIQNVGSNTHAQIDTHIASASIHFESGSIPHGDLQDVGSNTHTQIDSHIADGTIHFVSGDIVHNDLSGLTTGDPHTQYALVDGTRAFTGDIIAPGITGSLTEISSGVPYLLAEGSVVITTGANGQITISGSGGAGGTTNHSALDNLDANDHPQYLLTSSYEVFSSSVATHIADSTIHFTEASIDHTAIQNVGSNTHAQIDTHIADTTIHFTSASIVHNDLSGLTTGDPHTQYTLVNGTRAFTGDVSLGGNGLTNVSSISSSQITGSLTEITPGVPYLLGEGTVTITTGVNGQITISGSGDGTGGGGGPSVDTADTTSSPQTVNLPALPAAGTRRLVLDTGNNAGTNAITIVPNGSDTIEGESAQYILSNGASLGLISDGNEWKIESRSTGAPVIPGVRGFTANDHYQAVTGALTGSVSGFSVEVLALPTEDIFSSMFLSCGTSNSGFRLTINNLNPSFNVYDDAGTPNFVDATVVIGGNGGIREWGMRPLHFVGVVTDQGTFMELDLFMNGVLIAEIDTFVNTSSYGIPNPGDVFRVGYSSATAVDAGKAVIMGVGYDESSWTLSQVSERYEEIKRAGFLVSGTLNPEHRYDCRDNLNASSSWVDVGSAATKVDLTLTGSLTTARHLWKT